MSKGTPVSLLSSIGPLAVIPVVVVTTDSHACPQTSDMCAYTCPPASNTRTRPDNASKIEACLSAGEDYPPACAVIESVCIAGNTEGKHNGKDYSEK